MKIKITQKREGDHINFYLDGDCVATLFDGHDHIIFDELAYGPALINDDIPENYVEQLFGRIGLDVAAARYIDSCPDLQYPNP